MELVEGATLAKRISGGSIPTDEALQIAIKIAFALEAAHERGIVHRDLKPANVIVRPDGSVKVLDFGLAKTTEPAGKPSHDLSQSPTLSMQATQAGIILGTAAYMSPEQAKGKPADQRSDLFSFGVVLFEMLSGERPFEGNDVSEILASVLAREPDWNELPPSTPPGVMRLLRRLLQILGRGVLGQVHRAPDTRPKRASRTSTTKAAVAAMDKQTESGAGQSNPLSSMAWMTSAEIVIVVIDRRRLLDSASSGEGPKAHRHECDQYDFPREERHDSPQAFASYSKRLGIKPASGRESILSSRAIWDRKSA